MLMKLLILVGAAAMFGAFVFRAGRSVFGDPADRKRGDGASAAPSRRQKTQDLVKCPGCGIFLPSDRTCDCRDAT